MFKPPQGPLGPPPPPKPKPRQLPRYPPRSPPRPQRPQPTPAELTAAEYEKYEKLYKPIKNDPDLYKIREGLLNFQKFAEAFELYKQVKDDPTKKREKEDAIKTLINEYSLIQKSTEIWDNGCDNEMKSRGCEIVKQDTQHIGKGGYGTVHILTCNENRTKKQYVFKIQNYTTTFKNEVEKFKQLINNRNLSPYIVKYYDSWVCNAKRITKGYIQLEKMDGDVQQLINKNKFTAAECDQIVNIIEKFHANKFVLMDSKPNNYLYKTIGPNKYHIVATDLGFVENGSKFNNDNFFEYLSLYDYYLFLINYYWPDNLYNLHTLKDTESNPCIQYMISKFTNNAYTDYSALEFKNNARRNNVAHHIIYNFAYMLSYYYDLTRIKKTYNSKVLLKISNLVEEYNLVKERLIDQYQEELFKLSNNDLLYLDYTNITNTISNFEKYIGKSAFTQDDKREKLSDKWKRQSMIQKAKHMFKLRDFIYDRYTLNIGPPDESNNVYLLKYYATIIEALIKRKDKNTSLSKLPSVNSLDTEEKLYDHIDKLQKIIKTELPSSRWKGI